MQFRNDTVSRLYLGIGKTVQVVCTVFIYFSVECYFKEQEQGDFTGKFNHVFFKE